MAEYQRTDEERADLEERAEYRAALRVWDRLDTAERIAISRACSTRKRERQAYWRHTGPATAIELYRNNLIDASADPTDFGRVVAGVGKATES